MKTVQMTFDNELIAEVDKISKQIGLTRSAFTRQALKLAINRMKAKEKEEQHKKGYKKHPIKPGEFDDWEEEQVWVD